MLAWHALQELVVVLLRLLSLLCLLSLVSPILNLILLSLFLIAHPSSPHLIQVESAASTCAPHALQRKQTYT
eukprot:5986343-Pyramimonas_sp.AAC.1